ncbi:TPA: hypothetical protein JG832_002482 [Enterobacter hormaechei subsp. xiangfangensis]|nr:hypothetical protein [Enterobacter hormaechei subsp. xiangfangensis]HAV1890617.1 hypothetical protein [Enterobacter hormaechei subsp. xiangfangensis]
MPDIKYETDNNIINTRKTYRFHLMQFCNCIIGALEDGVNLHTGKAEEVAQLEIMRQYRRMIYDLDVTTKTGSYPPAPAILLNFYPLNDVDGGFPWKW